MYRPIGAIVTQLLRDHFTNIDSPWAECRMQFMVPMEALHNAQCTLLVTSCSMAAPRLKAPAKAGILNLLIPEG